MGFQVSHFPQLDSMLQEFECDASWKSEWIWGFLKT